MSAAPEPLRLPEFELPFSRAINPSADEIVRHSVDWARDIGLVADAHVLAKLERDGIVHAGPRLVPTAPLELACLVSDWTLFLIVLDDEFDDRELGSRPDLAEAVIGDVLAGGGGGIGLALADLRHRFERSAPTREWLQGFTLHADEHIRSKLTEAEHRVSGRPLDVSRYVALRRVTGAPYTYAYLAELASRSTIPSAVRTSRRWQQLLDAFADVFLAIQDICSCAKEVASGDDLNLAVTIQRAEGCTLQEAVDRASLWLSDRAQSFDELCDLAPRTDGVARCVTAFYALLGGHLAWNSEGNPRYAAA